MKLFVTINNGINPLAIVTKSTILDIVKVLDQQVKYLKKPVKKSNVSKVAGLKPKAQFRLV